MRLQWQRDKHLNMPQGSGRAYLSMSANTCKSTAKSPPIIGQTLCTLIQAAWVKHCLLMSSTPSKRTQAQNELTGMQRGHTKLSRS